MNLFQRLPEPDMTPVPVDCPPNCMALVQGLGVELVLYWTTSRKAATMVALEGGVHCMLIERELAPPVLPLQKP
jgi:hypothetical protein